MKTRTRTHRKDATRRRIIAVAHNSFSDNGFLMTKTADIARRARIAHGTLFLHFPTREDLITAVVEESAGSTAGRIHQMARREMSVQEVLRMHIDGLRHQEAFYARLVLEGPLLPRFARSRLIIIQSAIAAYFARAAEREMQRGTLRRRPVGLLFNTWLGLLHHYICNRDLFAPGGSVLESRGADLLSHFLELVR